MKINVVKGNVAETATPVLVLLAWESQREFTGVAAEIDRLMGGKITALAKSGEISGKYKEFTFIHTSGLPFERVLVMGIGAREKFEPDMIRSVMARAVRNIRRIRLKSVAAPSFSHLGVPVDRAAALAVEGIQLGLYRFKKYFSKLDRRRVYLDDFTIVTAADDEASIRAGAAEGLALAEATNATRDLVNEPPNVLHPESFAEIARTEGEKAGMRVEVFDRAALEAMGMNLLLAVSRASVREPRMVVLRYDGGGGPHVGLVGKGITFDSGGVQVKPDTGMMRMHSDMAGAAAVLEAACLAARLRLPVRITAVLPMVENLISGDGYKPGDILRAHNGKTVEITHTDAEGRLLLADALAYAAEQGVECLVDVATLTGGCVVALGHVMAGVMGCSQPLVDALRKAGDDAAEWLWQLPVHDDYLLQMKSDVADLQNSGGRAGSAVTAAMFLREFTAGLPWAHLDIAGTATIDHDIYAYLKRPYNPKEGATGFGTRLLYHFLKSHAEGSWKAWKPGRTV